MWQKRRENTISHNNTRKPEMDEQNQFSGLDNSSSGVLLMWTPPSVSVGASGS